jgi:serine/threonine protein kinase
MIVTGAEIFGAANTKYEVQEFLGSGSFGLVYKVRDTQSGGILAVKTLAAPLNASDVESFKNEGKLAVGIRHENVIEYYYFHAGDEHPKLPLYILMEYADGGSLLQSLQNAQAQQKVFSAGELLTMFRQLVAGMAAVNQALVHRDIKPANILRKGDALKISDFGLAKLAAEATRTMTFKGGGTFPYMAPEAWRSEKNTIQLDIYALGMVFYELATLRHPFALNTDDPQKWMEAHLYQAVIPARKVNPAIGAKLSQIIQRMVEKSTNERFSDWSSISGLLEEAQPTSEENKSLIDKMLSKRLERDAATQAAAAEAQRKQKDVDEFCKLVTFQFQQTFIPPLREFIDEFNRAYARSPARISDSADTRSVQLSIWMPGGATISLQFQVVLDSAFTRRIERTDPFGDRYTRVGVQVPQVRDRRVQGWGFLQASDGKGINILLVERADEIYGEWMILINRSGMFSEGSYRPEPFAFDFAELEEGVRYIGVLGRYQVEPKPLDLQYIKEFISNYA